MPTVHVSVTTVEQARRTGALARYLAALTDDERVRHGRMRPDPRGDEFLVGRALIRQALARHAPGAGPILAAGTHGRLEAVGAPVSFNLSHAEGLVVCAVAASPVGVDVEKVDERRTEPDIWEHHFAPPEVAALAALPAELRCERFFAYWTLKEAYIKARGLGLAIPLREFWFDLEAGAIRIAFAPSLQDDPARWQFAQQRLGPDHLLAVALETAVGPIALSIEHGLP